MPCLIGAVAGVAAATGLPLLLTPAAPDRATPPAVIRPDLTPVLKRLDDLDGRVNDARDRLYWLQTHR